MFSVHYRSRLELVGVAGVFDWNDDEGEKNKGILTNLMICEGRNLKNTQTGLAASRTGLAAL